MPDSQILNRTLVFSLRADRWSLTKDNRTLQLGAVDIARFFCFIPAAKIKIKTFRVFDNYMDSVDKWTVKSVELSLTK
jgi:hypothetical protein